MKTDKKGVYLDACFVVSLLLKQHEANQQASEIAIKIQEETQYVSLFVIDEVLYALSKYKVSKEDAFQAISDFLSIKNIEVLEYTKLGHNLDVYLQIYLNSNLKPTDSMHLYFMKLAGVDKIATFDSDFIKHEKELGIEVIA